MHMMDFHWTKSLSGQYVDGHKCDNVMTYHQTKFLTSIAELFIHMCTWKDGLEEACNEPHLHTQHVVLWFHDELTFYANDRRKVYWVHGNETAKPHPKGEEASLMVTDFISADYGWLCSSCGEEFARILFCAGKSWDGYFTNISILQHAELAMDILDQHYPHDQHESLHWHVLVFNNASTHLKRANDALSAHRMLKFPTKPRNIPFRVERPVIGSNDKPVHGTNGKVLSEKIHMADVQCFYFPEGYEHAGGFKGMAEILKKHGFEGCKKHDSSFEHDLNSLSSCWSHCTPPCQALSALK
ncbi:hypothetical protein BDR05DRAFT_975240 [Suillus weaverae]|nr:hypothetical protein BDR05DRAFT_975240 [Suillus weaverae]